MPTSADRHDGLSVIIPAFNEENAIGPTLTTLKAVAAGLSVPVEIIVVDDGSADRTATLAEAQNVRVIRHPRNSGYGRSLLSGIESAAHDTIVIIDADGTYPATHIPALLDLYLTGFHMVVGARTGKYYQGSFTKSILRLIFRWLAEYTCGQKIPDINSGLRIFTRKPVLARRESLSTGFSFTTTITLLFMLTNHFVGYMPITYEQRVGKSKVRLLRDSLRSIQIILTAIAQFNPLKLFLLLIAVIIAGNVVVLAIPFFLPVVVAAIIGILVAWNSLGLLIGLMFLSLILIRPTPRAG